jgi:predicted RNase H-like nuclease (RuvC/YqgF family)
MTQHLIGLTAENAALRAEVAHLRIYSSSLDEQRIEGDAEIERLADEVEGLIESRDAYRDSCEDRADRIDRLGESVQRLTAERDALRADAERYRWLRSEHARHDPICHLMWKRNGDRSCGEWVNTAVLDTSIDLARAAATAPPPAAP